MKKLVHIVALVMGLLMAHISMAGAEIDEFSNPKYKGHLLDWCVNWGSGCGKPAADKWCQSKGYDGAEAFNKNEDVGMSTRLIGSNQVCDEQMCDSFTMIACFKGDQAEDVEEATFSKPKFKGKRLDWCLEWSEKCGKPAADAYCGTKGFDKAKSFAIAKGIGNTRLIGTGENCSGPNCDGFKYITCK